MSCVHYKFSSKMSYDTVTFNGLHISLCDLKRQIMSREKLKVANCDLQITNAQTKEEYADDNALIPRNSSVIVRRIPVGGVKATSKTYVISRSEPIDDSSAPISLAQLIQTANLAEANAPEEEKVKAVMIQSCQQYDPINYLRKPLGPPPPSYTCFRCGKPGHYIKNCPTHGDKNVEPVPRIKKSTGIPRSFMIEVEDPTTKGAMLTSTGKYAIPTISAYAVDNFRNGTGYTKRLRKQLQQQQQQQPPLLQPPAPLMTAVRPAALVTAGELYISSSGSISSVLEDKPLNVSLEVRGPTLNTGFEVRPHQCRVRGNNHCPSPAAHPISEPSQDAIGLPYVGRSFTENNGDLKRTYRTAVTRKCKKKERERKEREIPNLMSLPLILLRK
ncbi:hypothetical protein QYF61_025729 [Mycteria americana]|uniref:E3 ubiquitin-protein ligase RBBP6 n=1 Tax=Mycteria americana TaxID=33587 RepID=A0AAN7RJ08_MYCAM|nr:hypothetical protein QYF61_025729 [Mycteria americana]